MATTKNYRDYILEQLSLLDSISCKNMMDFCIKKVGVDHILFSLDYPYVSLKDANKFLEESDLSETDKEKTAHLNAEKSFKI